MVGRVRVEIVADGSYRLCGQDGRLCHSWLPGIELDDYLPINRGGFDEQHEAFGFKLAIDLIRAEAGLIAETPEQIEQERSRLDKKPGRAPSIEPQAALDRFADRIKERAPQPSLDDFAGRVLQRMDDYPVQRHPVSNPVVEHRRVCRSASRVSSPPTTK
jgi:hypothetical protein